MVQESLLPTLHLKISILWRCCFYQHLSHACCAVAYLLARKNKFHFPNAEILVHVVI